MSESKQHKRAVIIGAGPAGLTAAYELLSRTEIKPIVLEKSQYMGGISRTVNYKGNRIDIGGHRFFSKSDRVMNWWMEMMPIEDSSGLPQKITYQNQSRTVKAPVNGVHRVNPDCVMLVRERASRIYFLRRLFAYPLQFSLDTLRKLGLTKIVRIGASYMRAALFPIKQETNLEHFFVNRFGRELYETFFRSYTEKVWGVSCQEISAEWGAQRIKSLSFWKAIAHISRKARPGRRDLAQRNVETSLIEKFLYPKFGPGQMWEEVARKVRDAGGEIMTGWESIGLEHRNGKIIALHALHSETGERRTFIADHYFSTMPVKELIASLNPPAPAHIRQISDGLVYRDFITVGLLCRKLSLREDAANGRVKDNWIYIQEPDVLVGRLQIFNNWSPHMVADANTTWIGLEYFCYETDEMWKLPDDKMIDLAKREMEKIGIVNRHDVLDATILRMPKTYPAYFGSYDRFDEVKDYVNAFDNLFLIGRNGMHKYNNQDHSMLTAMTAVDNIAAGEAARRDNLWSLNTEQEYHEEKK